MKMDILSITTLITLVLRRRVVASLLRFFQTNFFSNKNILHQKLLCNHFYILYASFDVYEVKFGGVVGYGGSSKSGKIP